MSIGVKANVETSNVRSDAKAHTLRLYAVQCLGLALSKKLKVQPRKTLKSRNIGSLFYKIDTPTHT